MKLTEHFDLSEFVRSETALQRKIDNTPNAMVVANLRALCENVLEPLRKAYGKPITVTSGYRSPLLNRAVGGVGGSQHITGQAADISVGTAEGNRRLLELVQELHLPFDQMLDEYGCSWVHLSYSPRHRRQIIFKR